MPINRAGFLREFGHVENDHQPPVEPADPRAIVASLRSDVADLPFVHDRCGWWWCKADDPSLVPWGELNAALLVLRGHSIDPSSVEVARLAYEYKSSERMALEKEGYEVLEAALLSLDLERHAEELRVKYLAEVQNCLRFVPRGRQEGQDGAPIKQHQRSAAAVAIERDWGPEDVAAIMLLTGVERDANLEKLKQRWQKRFLRADVLRGRN